MANLTSAELQSLLGTHSAVTPTLAGATIDGSASRSWKQFSEQFATAMSVRLRPMVKSATRLVPGEVRHLTASQLGSQIDLKSLIHVWHWRTDDDPLAIVASPSLVGTFLDRLLGGRSVSGIESDSEPHVLSETDRKLAQRLITSVRQCVCQIVPDEKLAASLNSEFAPRHWEDAWMPDCSMLRIRFDVRFVHGGGTLDFVLPEAAAEQLADPASTDDPPRIAQEQGIPAIVTESRKSDVSLVAELARLDLSVDDVNSLAVGDILQTGLPIGTSAILRIDGQPVGRAELGTVGSRRGIRVS